MSSGQSDGIQAAQAESLPGLDPDNHPRGAGVYPDGLQPAALPGDLVEIKSEEEVRQVEEVVAQPGVNGFQSGTNVAAGGESTDNALDILELPDNFMGQFRIVQPGVDIPTDVRFLWDLTAQNAQAFATNQQRGFHDHETGTVESQDGAGNVVSNVQNDQLLEIYTFEGQDIYVTFDHTNSGGAQETVQDVRFSGYMYRLTPEAVDPPAGVRPIPIPNAPVVPKP